MLRLLRRAPQPRIRVNPTLAEALFACSLTRARPISSFLPPTSPIKLRAPVGSRGFTQGKMEDEYGVMDDSGETFVMDQFELESGAVLIKPQVRYRKFGEFNAARDNCVVVCHALTGNAAVDNWWNEIFGPGRLLDPTKYLIVCANVLGSCYGTTGPITINPATGKRYGPDFPDTTIRDSVKMHIRLVKEHLRASSVACVVGGSLGGMQTLEWAYICGPEFVRSMIPMCCGAYHRAWQIGISEAQRQAIYADPKWKGGHYLKKPGEEPVLGLSVARQIAMITYRSHKAYSEKFGRSISPDGDSAQGQQVHYQVEKYLRYQGVKFLSRFDALCYVKVTRMMDSHDLGRDRGGVEQALSQLTMPALVISVSSDALYPPMEQRELHRLLPNSDFLMVDSHNGHDGFLLDHDLIQPVAKKFMDKYADSPGSNKQIERTDSSAGVRS